MLRTAITLALCLSAVAFSQAPEAFEAASIRPSKEGKRSTDVGPGSVTLRGASLADCIRWAYDVQEHQISGPGWLSELQYDIVAKSSQPAPEPELRRMLQALLAERFKLELHRQKKEMGSLVLTLGKGPHKLVPADNEVSPSFQTGKLNLTGKGATLAQLTTFLTRQLRTPVVDETGLTGRFNYFLDINPYFHEEMRTSTPGPPPDAPSIIAQAVQTQLGLKIESKKTMIEVLIIDRMERTPTDN